MSKPSMLWRRPHHLVARFVVSLDPRPPAPAEIEWAESQLLATERDLWRRHSNQDRVHTIRVARRLVVAYPAASRAEIAGALLHDIGKIECDLGTWGRVAASVVGGRTRRFRLYLDHERIGTNLVIAANSDPATIDIVAEQGPVFAIVHAGDHA